MTGLKTIIASSLKLQRSAIFSVCMCLMLVLTKLQRPRLKFSPGGLYEVGGTTPKWSVSMICAVSVLSLACEGHRYSKGHCYLPSHFPVININISVGFI